ncbi:MAG TPA: FeoB-associated Cys-rich membrane protein [Candidatus Blautia gallistercoris]|uniref:FeoB-associated Cys-rich membrane protein n=1 Tax=Candidatus Blautia gallistercoris TaxID=2838490 RepID=A0A9D1WHX3_9FIRM|nr:FeoB-associated Cys-rich membrane protein [Candidatus Blautia gallistercoris]
MGTIIVGALVVAAVALAICSIRRDKKNGRASCGGNCGACGMCHHKRAE